MGLFALGLAIGLIVAAVMAYLYNKLETRLIFTQNQLQRQTEIGKENETTNARLRRAVASYQIALENCEELYQSSLNLQLRVALSNLVKEFDANPNYEYTYESIVTILLPYMLLTASKDNKLLTSDSCHDIKEPLEKIVRRVQRAMIEYGKGNAPDVDHRFVVKCESLDRSWEVGDVASDLYSLMHEVSINPNVELTV